MKMSRSVKIVYLVIFLAFLVLPLPAWKLYTAVGAASEDTANYENRAEAEKPQLTRETVNTFATSYETWFSENLPFRDNLLTARGELDYFVLQSTNTTSILVGRDGWIFYSGNQRNGEDPIADYKGTNLFTDEELSKIWMQLKSAQMMCDYMGKQFVVVLAPSKEHIYPDHMPLSYGTVEYGRLQQVTDYLREQGFDVVNPCDSFAEYRTEHPEEKLYYNYDTHWNRIGSYIATQDLEDVIGGGRLPDLDTLGREACPLENADLARLLHLGTVLKEDDEVQPTGYGDFSTVISEINDRSTEYIYNNSADDVDPRKVMIIGDSFSPMIARYLSVDYRYVSMDFYYEYTPAMLEERNPDVVVYEVTERYLMNLERFTLQDLMPIVPVY